MKLGIYSVRDQAVGAFLPPFFTRSKGEAIRSFSDAVNNKEHQFAKHVEDFVLMYHGEWDDVSGVVAPSGPERVLSAIECVSNDDSFPASRQVS